LAPGAPRGADVVAGTEPPVAADARRCLRAFVLRGATLLDFWSHLVVLLGMGLARIGLCAIRFRQEIT
jgi:hypothetical protein